jgi:putative membrane protein
VGVVQTTASILLGLVAALHVYFLVLEMFLWRKPLGRRVFRTTEAQAAATATLAANQGLYNGFLAAGLVWALLAPPPMRSAVATFFCACVIAAGIFGAIAWGVGGSPAGAPSREVRNPLRVPRFTVSRRILLVQALPAALALAAVIAA